MKVNVTIYLAEIPAEFDQDFYEEANDRAHSLVLALRHLTHGTAAQSLDAHEWLETNVMGVK